MNKIKYLYILISSLLILSCSKQKNIITVNTTQGLKKSKVEIRKGNITINRKNDLELFSTDLKTVFKGADFNNLETEFGENDFLVIYDDLYYYSFRHFIFTDFKSSYPDAHDYKFDFFIQNDSIFMKVNIEGQKDMDFVKPLIKIKDAKNFVCNTPIDEAGVIFNMKDMNLE